MRFRQTSLQVASVVTGVLPFAVWLLMRLWVNYVIVVSAQGIHFSDLPSSLRWVGRLGLNSVEVGLIPTCVCGMCGLATVFWGMRSRSVPALAAGAWACLAVPVLFVSYGLAFMRLEPTE